MSNLVKILVPSSTLNEDLLAGHLQWSCDTLTIYLTRRCPDSVPSVTQGNVESSDLIYGYCGNKTPERKFYKLTNIVVLNRERTCVERLIINKSPRPVTNIIIMHYDYEKMTDSQALTDSSDTCIIHLQKTILAENGLSPKVGKYRHSMPTPYWLTTSMFLQHIYNYFNLMKWLVATVKTDRKISIKQGNLILAVITDIVLGYFLLQLVMNNSNYIKSQLIEMLEKLINMLYSLLTWLMGAPVGLKLNKAFNNMLGKYFSYHVQLWWLFLDTCSSKCDMILAVYRHIGRLGFTFQIAVISDMICLATFHSYCIYVYAARLFNIQISGLGALARLFVGRKYNPLRRGVDSCAYSGQQLFVGTLACTVLLLLLPTAAMYYVVFTAFRIVSLAVQHIIAKLIYVVQTLPLYVAVLFFTNSNKVAGNILIELKEKESPHLVLRVKLLSKSIFELVGEFKPPVEVPKQVRWSDLISNILRGKQIL